MPDDALLKPLEFVRRASARRCSRNHRGAHAPTLTKYSTKQPDERTLRIHLPRSRFTHEIGRDGSRNYHQPLRKLLARSIRQSDRFPIARFLMPRSTRMTRRGPLLLVGVVVVLAYFWSLVWRICCPFQKIRGWHVYSDSRQFPLCRSIGQQFHASGRPNWRTHLPDRQQHSATDRRLLWQFRLRSFLPTGR